MYNTELRTGLALFLTTALAVSLSTPLWWIFPTAVALPVLHFLVSWSDEYLYNRYEWWQ